MYKTLATDFIECHQNPANVLMHLVTTSGFYLSMFAVIRFLPSVAGLFIPLIYGLSMLLYIPSIGIKAVTIGTLACLYLISESLELSKTYSAALFVISYLGQDLSHYLTSEATFQYRYTPSTPGSKITSWRVFYSQLALHSYFMLPLVFETSHSIGLAEEILSWFLVFLPALKLGSGSDDQIEVGQQSCNCKPHYDSTLARWPKISG